MTFFCLHHRDVLARQNKEAEHHAAKLQDEYTLLMAAARDQGPAGRLLDMQSKLAAHQTQCIVVRLISPCLDFNAYSRPAADSTCCCIGEPFAGLLLATMQQTAACSYRLVQLQTSWVALAVACCLLSIFAPVFHLLLKACSVCGYTPHTAASLSPKPVTCVGA